MKSRTLPLAALTSIALMGAIGLAQHPSADRDARINFVAWGDLHGGLADDGLPRVTITRCRMVDGGLLVEGHVPTRTEAVPVLVSGAEPDSAGVAVGAGFAKDAGKIPDGVEGDFTVTLPWATEAAVFAIAAPDSLGAVDGSARHGATTPCP